LKKKRGVSDERESSSKKALKRTSEKNSRGVGGKEEGAALVLGVTRGKCSERHLRRGGDPRRSLHDVKASRRKAVGR